MAVKLRLMRMGKTKQPTYRLVAADSRSPRDGRFIEIVGSYAPRQEEQGRPEGRPRDRWLQPGAQPTDRVRRILAGAGLMEAAPVRKTARPRRPSGRPRRLSERPVQPGPGGRARAVLEYLARQIVDEPDAVGVEIGGGGEARPCA